MQNEKNVFILSGAFQA